MTPTTKCLYDYLLENAKEKADARFLFSEKVSLTYKEVLNTSISLANELYFHGVKKGSLVALRATRSLETSIIFYSIEILGAVLVLCDAHNMVQAVLNDSKVLIEPDFIITNEDSSLDTSCGTGWALINDKYDKICALKIKQIKAEIQPIFDTDINVKDPALIIFTSGSTGKNKAVVLSQYNYLNHIKNYYKEGSYETDDISIQVLPMFHAFGVAVILMGLIRKYQIFFPKNTEIVYVANMLLKHKITRLDGVPSYAMLIANYFEQNKINSKYLRVGVLGGSPSSYSQFCYIEDTLHLKLLPVYGMSECIAISGAGKDFSREQRSNTVGKLLPMCDVKIIDENGIEIGKNQIGEITVSGPMVMIGYYKDETETNKNMKNGRVFTGDLGFIDEYNFLHIIGRTKDIIIRNGNNISTVKIENSIETIDEVMMCAVVGIADKKCGEVPAAMVQLKFGKSLSLAMLKKKMAKVLHKNEIPVKIMIVNTIPLTASKKINKIKVKEMING